MNCHARPERPSPIYSWLAAMILSLSPWPVLAEPTVDFNAPIPTRPFDRQAVTDMCLALRSEEAQVQFDAARYFLDQAKRGNIALPALGCLLDSVENGAIQPIQAHSGHALALYGAPAVPGLLKIARRHRENNAYWVSVGSLRMLGEEAGAAREEMLDLAQDRLAPDRERLDAADILWSLGESEGKKIAYRIMVEMAQSSDAKVRGHAVFAIVRTKKPVATRYLVECARHHEEVSWRVSCVVELGNVAAGLRSPLDPAEAMDCLNDLKGDPEAEIRDRVRRALEYVDRRGGR